MSNKKRVAIASKNPVKIETVRLGFSQVFPLELFEFEGFGALSGVRPQPLSDKETFLGATNRLAYLKDVVPDAEYYVALEGGVEDIAGELHEFAWILVERADGKSGKGKTATFMAPPEFRRLVLEEGLEVGDASDRVFKQQNSKQQMGAIGLLTAGIIDRVELYRHAVVSALIPFVQFALY